jgi:hypothetical protein
LSTLGVVSQPTLLSEARIIKYSCTWRIKMHPAIDERIINWEFERQ